MCCVLLCVKCKISIHILYESEYNYKRIKQMKSKSMGWLSIFSMCMWIKLEIKTLIIPLKIEILGVNNHFPLKKNQNLFILYIWIECQNLIFRFEIIHLFPNKLFSSVAYRRLVEGTLLRTRHRQMSSKSMLDNIHKQKSTNRKKWDNHATLGQNTMHRVSLQLN